ncbi:hypothetical protein X975_23282, partial [Stegodyphus mimosarum]
MQRANTRHILTATTYSRNSRNIFANANTADTPNSAPTNTGASYSEPVHFRTIYVRKSCQLQSQVRPKRKTNYPQPHWCRHRMPSSLPKIGRTLQRICDRICNVSATVFLAGRLLNCSGQHNRSCSKHRLF